MVPNDTNSIRRPHNPARQGQTVVKVVFFVLASVSVLGAAGWSTYSLYSLMASGSAHWAAFLACSVLDMAWIASLAMTISDAYGGDWRTELWSWGTLVSSATVSAMHGDQVHSWATAVLGVLFTVASKGLTQSFLHTLRPKLNENDRNRLKRQDYRRRVAELERQKRAELAHDEFRWEDGEPGSAATVELPIPNPGLLQLAQLLNLNQTPTVQLTREPEPELDIPDWVNRPKPVVPNKPELELAKVQLPVPLAEPEPPAPPAEPEPSRSEGVPTERRDKVAHLARTIGERGGQLNSVPLSEVIEIYDLKPTAKATASTLRKDAHQFWLDNAPGTGHYR
jgi:hypothetical protein